MAYIDMTLPVSPDKIDTRITLVTAYLDINRGDWSNFKRSTDTYINHFSKYLDYDYEMIIYIDDRYFSRVHTMIANCRFPNNKCLVPINIEWLKANTFFWKHLERDREIIQSDVYKQTIPHRISQRYPENTYSEYNLINHSKIDFIVHAIHNFSTQNFICWADFGYFGLYSDPSQYPKAILNRCSFNQTKINFCLRNKISVHDRNMMYTLCYAPEIFTGTVFAGPIDKLLEFQKLAHETFTQFQNIGITDDDQHLYLATWFKNPDLFQLYLSPVWPKALSYFS